MHPREWWQIGRRTVEAWFDDGCPRFSAALAFYTVFALAPLLLVVVAIAGLVFGEETARNQVSHQFAAWIGPAGAEAALGVLSRVRQQGSGFMATLVSAATVFIGATGVFTELQSALNTIWHAPPRTSVSITRLARDRLVSFAVVASVGFLLLVSLIVSAALSALGGALARFIPSEASVFLWHAVDVLVSFATFSVLFGLIYRVLPDVKLAWRDVSLGAGITAALFALGQHLIGLYLGRASVVSAYGAAGSIIVLLVWVYYSAMILLLGAELTKVLRQRRDERIARAAGERVSGMATRASDIRPAGEQDAAA